MRNLASTIINRQIDEEHLLENPFPGLRPFNIEESHLFFGREGQTDEVLMKISDNRFVAIIGPSGSGKSSFVYCGVLPILYGGFLAHKGPNWNVIVTRPGAAPIDNLAESIVEIEKALERTPRKTKVKTTAERNANVAKLEELLEPDILELQEYKFLVMSYWILINKSFIIHLLIRCWQ